MVHTKAITLPILIVVVVVLIIYLTTHMQKQGKIKDVPSNLNPNLTIVGRHRDKPEWLNQKYMTCDSIMNSHGLSFVCSKFYLGDDLFRTGIPTGMVSNYTVIGYERECFGRGCAETYKTCNFDCVCCSPYMGPDPLLKVKLWAPDSLTQVYTDNLNCTFPEFVPTVVGGAYSFTCNFTGYGFASVTKPLQVQLMAKDFLYPRVFTAFITAGELSLDDCVWEWERGSSWPVSEYGVIRVLLYDAFGNKISAATGGMDLSSVPMVATVLRVDNTSKMLMADASAVALVSRQPAYGLLVVTIYCANVGKYSISVLNNQTRAAVANMPTTFFVKDDGEEKDGEPPPTPALFFLGDILNVETGDTDTSFIHSFRPASVPRPPRLDFAQLVFVCGVFYFWFVLGFHQTLFGLT